MRKLRYNGLYMLDSGRICHASHKNEYDAERVLVKFEDDLERGRSPEMKRGVLLCIIDLRMAMIENRHCEKS